MDDTPLTVAEAALRLKVSTKTIRRYIADGRLAAYRVGQTLIRIDPAEVDKLLRPVLTVRAGGLGSGRHGSAKFLPLRDRWAA